MGSQCLLAGSARCTHINTNMGDNPEIWKAAAMQDHFEKIQKLPDKVDGVPNFRRVPGYKVYCCGQPTIEGFTNALNKACGDIYPKTNKIIWVNMRQEPIVYVNGNPICARPPNEIGGKKEHEVEVKSIVSLHDVIEQVKEKFPGLVHMRIPVCNSAAPLEADFDTLVSGLLGSGINTPVIVNCQVGLSRSTTGCVAACLFKEFQIGAAFEGLVETVPGANQDVLKMDRYTMDAAKDPLFKGEFEVIKELVAALPDGEAAKRECDKVIDKNGPAKGGGTGIKQLRENIAESKLSYEIMDDAAQTFLKSKIMDNIHKYFYLICFSAYVREAAVLAKDAKYNTPAAELKVPKTFVQYMEEHSALRTMVDEGKGKLQWERPIPPEALASLESLANADFSKNLGQIIHDIYQSAHGLFRDLPQGDHKKRAKYRFASKTLMRILPAKIKAEVEGLIDKEAMTMDLYEILGLCTWELKK